MGCRFLDLLDPQVRASLFWALNPCQRTAGYNNCYAAAAALFNYLATGARHAAVCIDPGQGLILNPDSWTPSALQAIMRHVRQGGHGTQVIVQGIRSRTSRFAADHAFNMVNINPPDGIRARNIGSVHAVDAYVNQLIPDRPSPTFQESYQAILGFCTYNEFRSYAYRTASYRVTIAP
jgi:hypothetical protein